MFFKRRTVLARMTEAPCWSNRDGIVKHSAVWIYKFALVGIEVGNVDRLDSCSQRRHLERHAGLESLFLGPLNIVNIEHHYRIFTARYFLCSKQMLQGQVPIFELQPRQ